MSTKAAPNYSEHTGAKGGGQLGRSRDFLKESDAPDANIVKRHGSSAYKNPTTSLQDYSSKGAPAKRTGDKCLPTVKPRS